MTQRERLASGGTPSAPRSSAPPPAPAALPWDELFCRYTPAQQSALLDLARRQGGVFGHQLPAPANGVPADAARQLLTKLLAGQTDDLKPLCVHPLPFHDTELDAPQREAVARAVQTPDICLIRGLPGTGKSRVAAEIVTQTAARGERILLLAPSAAAVDRVLGQVAGRDAVCAARCPERDETLTPAIRALTLAERARTLTEQARAATKADAEANEQRAAMLAQDEAAWTDLTSIADALADLEARQSALAARQNGLQAEAEAEASFAAWDGTQRDSLARVEAQRTQARGKRDERRNALDALAAELEPLRPLVEAKKHWKVWSGDWWQATLHGERTARWDELTAQREQLEQDLAALDNQVSDLTTELEQLNAAYQAERTRRLEAAIHHRRGELAAQEQAQAVEKAEQNSNWRRACARLGAESPRPEAPTLAGVAASRGAWQRSLEQARTDAAFARQWLARLEREPAFLADHLPAHVNLVAATTGGLASDPHFGEQSPQRAASFDLLVLDEADQVTESEFLRLARRARRWVLIGEPNAEVPPAARAAPHRAASGKPHRPAALRPGFFQQLWQQLHLGPVWVQNEGRLVCRMRPVPPEQRSRLETERVADNPDVELRILTPPHGRPALAEVVFPPGMPLAQAKRYIFEQLDQLPVRAAGAGRPWIEESDRLILRLTECSRHHSEPVVLEPGVSALVGYAGAGTNGGARPGAWETCCVEFARGAGWHQQRAEEWAERHVEVRDLGRTVALDVPHRMASTLASVLSELMFDGAYQPHEKAGRAGEATAFEFVPVPPVEAERRRGRERPEPPRSGAGLELDLADARHRDRLPAELRPSLPARGLVNYLEAQAVVRKLAALAADPALRRVSIDNPAVVVLALSPAQAELIRQLARQAPALADGTFVYRVETPAALRQGEAAVVLVSLTRSHTHRAVPYGDGPHALVQALTRARDRLIVFGDIGTLTRRGHWEGPLDHLDEAAAERERELAAKLARWAHAPSRPPRPLQLCEGRGP